MAATYLAAFLAVIVGFSSASDVLEFNTANFDEKCKEHDVILVEFYAPWCGHCKALAPKYEEAATKLKEDDIPLAKVDCDAEKDLCSRFNVGGFPTLKIFRKGEFSKDYDGPREASGIVKYMQKEGGPSSAELKSEKDVEKFLDKDEYVVVGCFEKDSKLKETFLSVASSERDHYRFAHTSEASFLKKHKCKDDIIVFQPKKLHNKFEKAETKYDKSADDSKIKDFLKSSASGLCDVRDSSNADRFSNKPLVVVYYNVDYIKDPKGTNYWRNRVLKVAQDYKQKVYFAVSSKDSYSHEIDEYGLAEKKSSDKPVVAAQGAKGEKFSMSDDFSVEALKKFVEDLVANKLESYLKSEPIPENKEPLKVVVAKNFNDIVNDESKDVLIEFYAPWCGHCKQLAPKYEELANKLKDEPEIIIAKMDATANDVPQPYQVSGFPTIYWSPRGSKGAPEQYQGGREVKEFIKYIAKKSTNELNGWNRDGKKKKEGKKEGDKEEL